MPSKLSHRESGIVLLGAVMVVMMLFAVTTVALNFSMSESNGLDQRVDESKAFYLAESAVSAATLEIISGNDPGQDGLGTLAASNSVGSYDVQVTTVGEVYSLVATGTASGGSVVTLETTIEFTYDTVFPGAAMSFVGDMSSNRMDWDLGDDVIL